MLWHPQNAEDATQEILIKIVTGLSSFRGESSFRTWAYRIATNHVLNLRRSHAEKRVTGFDVVFPLAQNEKLYLPSWQRIVKAVEKVLAF